jgi:hypothetical protein
MKVKLQIFTFQARHVTGGANFLAKFLAAAKRAASDAFDWVFVRRNLVRDCNFVASTMLTSALARQTAKTRQSSIFRATTRYTTAYRVNKKC